MTHEKDTERQAFEAVASDNGKWPKAIERDAKGNYLLLTTANGWMWWKAARRAPSVPDQSIIEAVDGWFARNTGLGGCSDKDVAELAAIFAAAPQPPEAAPVQLPEPSAWMLGCQTMGGDVGWKLSWSKSGAGVCHRLSGEEFEHPLYTEQQVRDLLAATYEHSQPMCGAATNGAERKP